MGIKSFWLENSISDEKLRDIAEKQKKSVSKLINNLLKEKYNILKRNSNE